jgi:transcriptional antiterminator RfaH
VKQWYALRSKPRRESMAADLLTRAGIEVYVPQVKVSRQRGKPTVVEPFFPGYFFSRLDPSIGEIRLANYTSGVLYVVGYGGQPWPVPDPLISEIQKRLIACAGQPSFLSLHAGDRVVITDGPLRDLEAVFDRQLSATGRVRVLIGMLSRLCRADLLISQLRPVD